MGARPGSSAGPFYPPGPTVSRRAPHPPCGPLQRPAPGNGAIYGFFPAGHSVVPAPPAYPGKAAGRVPAAAFLEHSGPTVQSRPMNQPKSGDPLHGITLERLLTELVGQYGWEELGRRVEIRCFLFDPSIKSSLVFLRKTPWARSKVEAIYVSWKAAEK
jgi:hypothetical protein